MPINQIEIEREREIDPLKGCMIFLPYQCGEVGSAGR